MNGLLIRIVAGIAGLAILQWSLACGSDKQGGARESNPCSGISADRIVEKLNGHVNDQINRYPSLKDDRTAGRFGMEVIAGNGNYAVLHVWGSASGEHTYEAISDMVDEAQSEGCIMEIKMGRPAKDAKPLTESFEWNYCEHPNCPGPAGNCIRCDRNDNKNRPFNGNANTGY